MTDIIIVSEHYYTYLSRLFAGGHIDIIDDIFHMDSDGEIILTKLSKRITSSAESTYDLGCVSARWDLIQRLIAGGMDIEKAVRLAIRMYNNIPMKVVLTDNAVDQLCAHYANDGDRSLVFAINREGELTIRQPESAAQR
jgi:hypothetical protein